MVWWCFCFCLFCFVVFEEEWQASQQHGQDPLTGSLSWVLRLDQLWSGGRKIKDGAVFCGEPSAGLQNPGGGT